MDNLFVFTGGETGPWRVTAMWAVAGEELPPVSHLAMTGKPDAPAGQWRLSGFTSNLRYATAGEVTELRSRQEGLGRAGATCAALIPIRKSARWWEMAQDERRAIFEETSRHTAIGLDYLPAVARRLHHSRDLGEPFDFLTWFEFAPEDAPAFERLVERLRATQEWAYVEREVDIRLVRAG